MEALLATAVTVGLLGGVHCIAMCGGIVGAYTIHRADKPPLRSQLLFNAGRIGSYCLAGALAGGASGAGVAAAQLLPAQTMLFVAANGLLILLGLHLAGRSSVMGLLEGAGARLWPLLRAGLRRIPDTRTTAGQLAAGAAWGWTPCGMVYGMLALALVSGSAARGASIMLAFGLSTLPNLLAAGWLARRFGVQFRQPRARLAAGLLVSGFGIVGLLRIPGLAQSVREGILCVTG